METGSVQERRNGWLVLAIGVAVVAAAIGWQLDNASFVSRAATTTGRVVELRAHPGSKAVNYHPVVTYTPGDGPETTFEGSSGSNPPGYRIGEEVAVLWVPGHPEGARVRSFVDLWIGPPLLGVLGVLLGLLGVHSLRHGRGAADGGP